MTSHELGSGSFGHVYSAEDLQTKKQVVCKVVRIAAVKDKRLHRRRWFQEVDHMKQMNHVSFVSRQASRYIPITKNRVS